MRDFFSSAFFFIFTTRNLTIMKTIFYNSSLPRAGSTLFQNIIAQNPDFYATPTSGALDLIFSAKNTYQNSDEFKAQDPVEMEKAFLNFCRQGFVGYFDALTEKPYILDKNRGWGVQYNLANMLYENPKIVCMVRDIRAIFSSMEKNFRKNPHKNNYIQNPAKLQGTTLDKRIDIWATNPPLGLSLDRLKDIFQQGINKNMLFIRYEDLMSNPEQELKRYYNFINLPYYKNHDFVNITQHTQENDVIHGIYGDHKLRPKFEKLDDDFMEILGYDLCQKIKNTYQWFFNTFNYI